MQYCFSGNKDIRIFKFRNKTHVRSSIKNKNNTKTTKKLTKKEDRKGKPRLGSPDLPDH